MIGRHLPSATLAVIVGLGTCNPLLADDSDTPVAPQPSRQAALGEPITYELFQKISLQTGFGPEDSTVGNSRKSFHSISYEPTFIWYSPEKDWANWQFYSRASVNYDSSNATTGLQTDNNLNDSERERPEHFYAELREFYIKRNLLWDDPRYSVSLGRQAFSDRYGIWWDDSIESLRFNYNDSFANGFIAIGQKFWNYNTDVNSLDPAEEDTLYLMGEYAVRWSSNNWLGLRVLHEDDRSDNDIDDRQDFTGQRIGMFFRGADLTATPLFSDYHLELATLRGDITATDNAGRVSQHKTRGAAALGEIGKRFQDLPWTPRVALRAGITDKPDDENDGFYLNRIQSDRIVSPGSYNTRLVSSFINLNLRNLKYYGVALETQPTPRSSLDLRISDLYLRDSDGDLPIRIDREQRTNRRLRIQANTDNGGTSIGQVIDLNYYWKMFPLAYQGKHIDLNALVSASYLRAGNAVDSGDDYQVSFGIVARY